MNQQAELAPTRPAEQQEQADIQPLSVFARGGEIHRQEADQGLIAALERRATKLETAPDARRVLDQVLPLLPKLKPNARLYIALGMLTEKLRQPDGMLDFWADLNRLFPTEEKPLRLMMRWYRRSRQLEEGCQRLRQICQSFEANPGQAQRMALGYVELRAFSDLDAMMVTAAPSARLQAIYIEALLDQQRIAQALEVHVVLSDKTALSSALRERLDAAKAETETLQSYDLDNSFDSLGRMVDAYRELPPQRRTTPYDTGTIAFFTGQLGMGGAERQMTRLASRLQKLHLDGVTTGQHRVNRPPLVCVRHTTPSSQSDFFLPVLEKAGVATTVLTNCVDPGLQVLDTAPQIVCDLWHTLPEDVQHNTCKLVRYFRENAVDVAYLWQDGGVLTAALAALIARVPRIIVTFRGMPPNQRPELFRPQMTALNTALARLPWVTLTTNSEITARSYEDWLGLPEGQIKVIYNAVEPLTATGAAEDEALWADLERRSKGCDRTVLGVFRFDHNKRPDAWIDVAARSLRRRTGTRFIVIGRGHELTPCRERVAQMGLADRIYLLGPSSHVGFWMHRANALLHLARFEGLPNSLIEAAHCGLPAITTPAGGAAEIVACGTTGFVLPSADSVDPDEVCHRLDRLLDDRTLHARLSAAAQTRARTLFDTSRVLEQTLDLINDRP